jgi:ABC-type amino acid transport substrate-binding protein
VIDDSPMARHFSDAVPGLIYAQSYEDTASEYAIMVRKGNSDLRGQVNSGLEIVEQEGKLAKLLEHWFGTTDSLIV